MKKQTKKNKKNSKKLLKKLYLILFILIFLITFFLFYFIKTFTSSKSALSSLVSSTLGQSQEDLDTLEPLSILLLGSSQNLTDTIMIFQYVPQTQRASLLSIPRDTFTGTDKSTAISSNKINCLYQGKYPEKTLKAVNSITGLDIKYYAIVDTEALKVLIDTIGGVYFDVPIDMNYTDKKQNLYINLKAGYQLLDGDKAEQLVRFRHNSDGSSYPASYGDNDYGRMKTQRNFLKEVLKQTISAKNATKISELLKIAQNYLKTNISYEVIEQYIAPAINFNTDNLETDMLPGVSEKCNGLWFYIVNSTKTKEMLNDINDFLYGLENIENVKIEILNGADNTSLTSITKKLKNEGFTIQNTKEINTTKNTIIFYKNNTSVTFVNYIKNLISSNHTSFVESSNIFTADITIILGNDIN